MFAGHEALFNISHFQVVQRQHILLLFFLEKKWIKTTLCEKKPDVSKLCYDLGTFVIIRKCPNLNVCLSFIDLPAREMKPQFQFCFSLTLLKHFLIKKVHLKHTNIYICYFSFLWILQRQGSDLTKIKVSDEKRTLLCLHSKWSKWWHKFISTLLLLLIM